MGEVVVTGVDTSRRERAIEGDKGLGLLGGDQTLLHGLVGDGDRTGLGSKGDLELVNGEEDLSGGIGNDKVTDKRPFRSPNLGLA